MNPLRMIRNPHAVQKLAPKRDEVWGKLAPPIDGLDNFHISRALSLLACFQLRDGALTPDQARFVIRHFEGK